MTKLKIDPAEFDLDVYLAQVDPAMLKDRRSRVLLTRYDPLLFQIVYFPHHLKIKGEVTFSEFHVEAASRARHWVKPASEPKQQREIIIAPRDAAKSTWYFLFLPMWAAAHGHKKFICAFSGNGNQAKNHLATFINELHTNKLLRHDFPELCTAGKRPTGTSEANRADMYASKPLPFNENSEGGGPFYFAARGLFENTLGIKRNQLRPDLLLGDDIEPGEETYSLTQKDSRLKALTDSILPMNIYARVVVVGTTVMAGSIIHDAVQSLTLADDEEIAPWLKEGNFKVRHYHPILQDSNGKNRSLWEEKWSLEYLEREKNTMDFAKNMENDPIAAGGRWWRKENFVYGMPNSPITHQMLTIDPAVTEKKTSDYTALSIIAYSAISNKCVVLFAQQYKVAPGEPLRAIALELLKAYPGTNVISVETNQGGEMWRRVLHDMGLEVLIRRNHEPKNVRAAKTLRFYQFGQVLHARKHKELETQMIAYPKAKNDDLIDCVGDGVRSFLDPESENH